MDDLELALALADRADAITMRRFGEAGLGVRAKPDRSLVTEVDTEVEAALRAFLAEHRPSDSVLGEESGGAGSGGRRWVLDPLDHTNNYVRGLPVFATLIALEEDGEVLAGVASAPAMARRWWASRGHGAYADGERIHVSAVADLPDAHVTFAALHRWERRDLTSALAKITEAARYEWGSGGFWGQMLVAEGRLDASLDPWGEIWDLAAPKIIVEEAGGRFTDLLGEPRIDQGCALATNGLLHDDLVARLKH